MNNIHPTAIINWDNVTIGDGNNIGPYVCIGTDAQHKSENSNGIVEIGDSNTFREYVTVHRPLNGITKIGNNKYEFGIVPMPGIESVDVKALERGSIRRATVTLKAYNKEQFDIIDILYLRLGYTLLLLAPTQSSK